MKRVGCMTGIVAGALLGAGVADAAPTLRLQVDQSGDFVMIGNTLAHDCATGVPAPVVGTVGNCGTNTADSSPDVFWRADDVGGAVANNTITLDQARSTAVLDLPTGAVVTHAFMYWAGESTEGNQADLTATIERPGAFTQDVTAVRSATSTWQGSDFYYQSVADVTQLVQQHGVGPYRVSGVQTQNLVNRSDEVVFATWTLVVFYELDTDPPRNLAIFDGLDLVAGSSASATLSGFLVPFAGFDAKLGVIAYEGDGNITGDQLRFGTGTLTNADRLSDGQNPLNNFFNSTRSFLGTPVSNVGDLPQLTGTSRSMGSYDIDVVDITSRLTPGQTSANIEATTTGDVYFLGAFITSISTYKPNFSSSMKTVTDVNGGALLPGDVLAYTIDVVNTGNDTAVNVELADQLPTGVTYRPGSLEIVSGPNAGMKTDAADTDQAEFVNGSNTVFFRLGTGADGTMGGSLPVGGSTTVRFEVTLDANASGTIENQAFITAEGDQGAPQENTPTDGNGAGPGAPPTVIVVDACGVDADCTDPSTPYCATAPEPNLCVQCLTTANCGGTTPVCDASFTCVGCTTDANCSGATPACQPSGACGQCSTTNASQCTDITPVCEVATGTCVACTSDSDCSGATPACQASGACGECSSTNQSACTGSTPLCNEAAGTCVACLTYADCGGNTPVCASGVCVAACENDAQCGGPTSGIVCDGSCVPGCRGQNGNGCPDEELCTSTDETIGECVPESDGGTGGTGGTAGTGGTGGIGGAAGTSGTGGAAGAGGMGGMGGSGATGATGGMGGSGGSGATGGTSGAAGSAADLDEQGVLEGGGCSCNVPGSGSAPMGLGLLTVLAGLLGLRSRRRR